MSRSASSAAHRKSWKQTAATRRQGSKEARQSRALGWTLLAVALIALLAWMLWPRTNPRTQFVHLPILKYDPLVPVVEYVEEDYEPLTVMAAASPRAIFYDRPLKLIQDADRVATVGSLMVHPQTGPQDVMILFVSAHGVSADGKAYIACSDYLRNEMSSEAGLYELNTFLNTVNSHPAQTKLVVFDTGRMQYDPTIAMVLNEFPEILADAVEALDPAESNMYVLSGAGMLQYPHALYDQRRTLFAHMVVQGLSGAADPVVEGAREKSDNLITLDELYKYVHNRMSEYFPFSSGRAQTPLLMEAGQGLVTDFAELKRENVFLIALHDVRKAEQPAEDGAAEGESTEPPEAEESAGATDSARQLGLKPSLAGIAFGSLALFQPAPAAGEAAAGEAPAEGADAADPPAEEPAKDSQPPAAESGTDPAVETTAQASEPAEEPFHESVPAFERLLHKAWQLRDQLQSRSLGEGWSPVDFAPHSWRVMNERLLDMEHRYLAGSNYADADLQDDLEREIEALQQLVRLMEAGDAGTLQQGRHKAIKLLNAWFAFVSEGEVKDSFEQASGNTRLLKSARRNYNTFLYDAPDFVRWYDRNSFSSAGGGQGLQDIRNYLADLYDLQKLLEDEGADYLNFEFPAKRVEDTANDIRDSLQRQFQAAKNDLNTPEGYAKLAELLATPLLNAAQRREAIRLLLKPGREPPDQANMADPVSMPVLEITPAQWAALATRVQLHSLLIRLSDRPTHEDVARQIKAVGDSAPNTPEQREKQVQQYRELGRIFGAFYGETLPAIVLKGNQDQENQQQLAAAQRALRMLPAREVERLDTTQLRFPMMAPLPRLHVLTGPSVRLTPDIRNLPLKLSPEEAQLLQVPLDYHGDAASVAEVALTFDPRLIGVRKANSSVELASNRPFAVPLTRGASGVSGALALEVWAKQVNTPQVPAATLAMMARVNDLRSDPVRINCPLPNKNHVQLLVQRVGTSKQEADGPDGTFRLRSFPNRDTEYRLWLENESGEAKKVSAQLLAIPKASEQTWAPHVLSDLAGVRKDIEELVFERGSLRRLVNPAARVVAAAASFELPGTPDSPVLIPFKKPAVGAPPAEAGPTAAAPPSEQPPPNVSHGMVLLVREEASGDQWVKWLEIEPINPAEYISAKVNYDAVRREIQVSLRPRLDEQDPTQFAPLVPPNLAEHPITVHWDKAATGLDLVNSGGVHAAQYRGGPPVELTLNQVPPESGREREIWLDIDGYPRAMAFTVICEDRPGEPRWDDPDRNLRQSANRLNLKWLTFPDPDAKLYNRMFFYNEGGQPVRELIALASGRDCQAVFLDHRETAWFPAAKNTAPTAFQELQLRLEVDANSTAFNRVERGSSVIEVGFQRPQRFYADRDRQTTLLEAKENGLLKVRTNVDDFTVQLPTFGFVNQTMVLTTALMRDGEPQNEHPAHRILFDERPPQLRNLRLRPDVTPVPLGATVTAYVEAVAEAGIDKVEFSLFTNPRGEGAPVATEADFTTGPDDIYRVRQDNTFSASFKTKDLKPDMEYWLSAVAHDRIGLKPSQPERILLRTSAPPPPPEENQPKPKEDVFGTITGSARIGKFSNFAARSFDIVLEGDGKRRKVPVGPGGSFKFTNVKVGPEYKLWAEDRFQQKDHYGEVEGVQAIPPGERGKPVDLELTPGTKPNLVP